MATELAGALWTLRTAGSVDELARRYRRLCKLFHPDLQVRDERAAYERHMQRINQEYADALKKYNIYTYRKPPRRSTVNATRMQRESHDEEARASNQQHTAPAQPQPRWKQPRPGVAFAGTAAARELGRALAILQDARTFFSLKATDDAKERECYAKALALLESTHRRFPRLSAGQDALYYMATIRCNLKQYEAALKLFARYRELYPADQRNDLFHFYAGLCHHRLGCFARADVEYGRFLLSDPGPRYRHFAALVATFKDAATGGSIPQALPYG